MPDPVEVELAVGEERVFTLPSFAGAGYDWDAEVYGDAGAVAVDLRSTADPAAFLPPGASPELLLVVRGVNTGRATVRLICRRPWDPDHPLEERILRVTVSNA